MTENLKEIEDEIIKELILFLFKESQENLIADGSLDTANLLRDVDITKDTLHYKAPYADIIDKGRKPGAIHSEVLEGWVRRKLGIRDPKEIKRVSFLIARKIRLRGFEGTEFMTRSLVAMKEKFKGKSIS